MESGMTRNNLKILGIVVMAVLLFIGALAITLLRINNQNSGTGINFNLPSYSPSPGSPTILPKIDISSDIVLNGSVYNETINVLASNIVINGNGSTVQGPGVLNFQSGFNLTGVNNVTIFNVTVTGWQYGFYLNNSGYNNISGNTANNNADVGFYLYNSSYNTFYGNNVTNSINHQGFYLHNSSYNNISGNTVAHNGASGIFLNSSSNNNTLSGNTAANNANNGFLLDFGSNNNTFSDNNGTNNGDCGFALYSSSYDTLSNNTANKNQEGGIFLSSIFNSTLSSNNLSHNYFCGVWLYWSSYNILENNTANNNYYAGFYIDCGQYNTLLNNTAGGNGNDFYLQYSSHNNITGNSAGGEIELYYSFDNILVNNTGSVDFFAGNTDIPFAFFILSSIYSTFDDSWTGSVFLFIIILTIALIGLVVRDRRKNALIVKSEPEFIPTKASIKPEPVPVPIKPKPKCLSCGLEIPEDAEFCPHCGESRARCSVCHNDIVSGDRFIKCPYCGVLSHRDHLAEWIKLKGTCPNCRRKLKQKDIS